MEYKRIIKKMYLEALVSSEFEQGVFYKVVFDKTGWTCECKANKIRKETCKHIILAMKEEHV
jgi:hypothetical protein